MREHCRYNSKLSQYEMTLSVARSSTITVPRSLGLIVGLSLLHRLLMVITANNLELRTNINDFFTFALSLGAAIGMFYVSYRFREIRRVRVAWALLGLGIAIVTVGAIIYALLDLQGMGVFPSIADAFYLSFYPIFGAGLVIMSWSSLSKLEFVKSLMDMAIVMLAAFLVFWILLIAPILAVERGASLLTVLVAIAYPILDWALIFAILRVLYSGPGYTHPASLLILALASFGQVVDDAIYLAQALAGKYVPGSWVDMLSVIVFSLLILVITYQLSVQPKDAKIHSSLTAVHQQFKWAGYIPNLWAVIAYFLLVWAHKNSLPISFEMLSWIVGGILALIIARQIVAIHENVRLREELQAELVERRSAEGSVRKLNEELEHRVLERTTALTQEIAERKQVEAEREKLILELGAKNKELENFTYTVSHDLKAPLVTIRGFLGFLEKDVQSHKVDRIRADVTRIDEATNKMQRLLNELLDLSRIGRMMNPPVDEPFNLIVQDAVELVYGKLTEREVSLTVAENMPVISGDRVRLIQVMQNLIENAIKFMGTQVNPLIEIGQCGEEAGKPIFFIRDNGMGISPEHHERIFGIFNKLNPEADGTGIGLSLVKRIIEAHCGRIWLESEVGKGSTFYFTLSSGLVKESARAGLKWRHA